MTTRFAITTFLLVGALTADGPALAAGAGGTPAGKAIWNGTDLSGWDGDPKFWKVEDGAITGETTKENPVKGNTFLIWRAGSVVDDFELRFQIKIVGGNSGVQYRSVEKDPFSVAGYQADFETGDTFSGAFYEEKGRGLLAKRGEKVTVDASHKPKVTGSVGDSKKLQDAIKKEDWNDYEISAKGNHFIHKINGKVTADVTDNDPESYKRSGILALQLHAGAPMKVQFRNLQLLRTPLVKMKKVVFIAGGKSHKYGSHDHLAGCHLLANQLEASGLPIQTAVYYPGWPTDPTAFDNATAIVVYADGGARHPIVPAIDAVAALARKGIGIGFLHYAVEVEKGKVGDAFLDFTGGYFEAFLSVNPHWTIENMKLAKHPITNGVKPYSLNDEWYFNMRFRPKMAGVIPLMSAVPPASTMSRPDDAHAGNPIVREQVAKGQLQHMMWARQRPDGGRGFGFTGGHHRWNWAQPDNRRLVMNAIAWIAKVDVPKNGVPLQAVTLEDLEKNSDEPVPADFDRASVAEMVTKFTQQN